MNDATGAAGLLLKLFELRTEPALRQARAWFAFEFHAANTEHFALYAKLRPFLSDIRAASNYPDYLLHVEKVVQTEADPESRISIFARYMERQRKLAAEGKQRSYLTNGGTTVADQRAVLANAKAV